MTDVGSAALCFVSTRAPRGLRQNIRPSDYAGVVVHRSLRFAQNRFLYSFQDTFWGGYAGYFQDPDQHLWEVVWNPQWRLAELGKL